MIELSPLDVRKKKDDFRRALRGYDAGQVDNFLDLVADRLEQLVSRHRELSDKVAAMEEKLEDFRTREGALNEALMAAQELREEARSQAERDAQLRIQEAEAEATDVTRRAEERVRKAREDLERLQERRERFLRSLQGTLRRFLEEVEEERQKTAEPPSEGRPAEEAAPDEEEAPSRSIPRAASDSGEEAAEEAAPRGTSGPDVPETLSLLDASEGEAASDASGGES